MPRVPSVSPATGNPTSSSYIHTTDFNFVDNAGRTLLLRGVNLSGSSKAPVGKPSYVRDGFWEEAGSKGESFVGRPLNLDDGTADIHLARLRGWGFNMLRYPVTWESLEHEGPGKYDYEFMDYTIRVLRKCKEYGFKVYMDPHQDVWSRFSGGSGAPFWTIPACGIDAREFTATQAAIVHCEYPYSHEADPASMPAMIWSTNYGRLASQTLFTLFFAGRDFAPRCIIDGKNIQDYLQEHFIAAMGQMADRIRDAGDLCDECVIGWDSMNEPFEGLCGWTDLNVNPTKQSTTLKKGTYPTPAQSLRLGMGQAQTVDNWSFGAFGPAKDGTVTIDPKGHKIWMDPSIEPNGVHPYWGWKRDASWELGSCVWALHGVWDIETGYIMRPDYFRICPPEDNPTEGEVADVEFINDYWKPHFLTFSKRIRQSHPEAMMFLQPPVFAPPPRMEESELMGRCVYSPHYYDGLTLISRHWNWFNADALGILRGKYSSMLPAIKIGEGAIRKSIQEQLGILQADTELLGDYPTVIGEIGTPFDMDGKRSYGWTDNGRYLGDYNRQERALDASLNAADGENAINWTVWTFCPDASHEWGDGWNMEDLSLWSPDDVRKPGVDEHRYYWLPDEQSSKATLLKNASKPGFSVKMAAASSLSVASIGVGAAATLMGELKVDRRTGTQKAAWHENPLEFLTDGSRAVRAFCRPWPVKVIGKSKNIQFDISKAEFKLTVTVRPEDRLSKRQTSSDDVEELATEIFIPIVHYAHRRVLSPRPQQSNTPPPADDEQTRSVDSSSSASSSNSREASTVQLPPSTGSSTTAAVTFDTTNLTRYLEEQDVIDVDVTVSNGRWSVEKGQTLKWWYEVPKDDEAPKEYQIVVKRKGGPIKLQDVYAASWTETLCPNDSSCRIM